MKRFIDLKPQESIDLDIHLFKNANSLKKDGELLFNSRNSFASANSLLILSSEEIVKAILIFLHSKKYNVYKLKEANKFFKDHKIRHQIAQLIEMGSAFIEALDIWHERKKQLPKFKTKYNWLNDILNGICDLADAAKPFTNSLERIKKLEEFNDNKNKGFYVDYRNAIVTPQEIQDKLIFEGTFSIVNRLFRFYKLLRILHHPSLKNHIPEEEINNTINELRSFLNNAMDGFSFKK